MLVDASAGSRRRYFPPGVFPDPEGGRFTGGLTFGAGAIGMGCPVHATYGAPFSEYVPVPAVNAEPRPAMDMSQPPHSMRTFTPRPP